MTAEKLLEHQGAILLAQSDGCAVWQFRNETGDGTMTTYEIFSGVMLAFNDFRKQKTDKKGLEAASSPFFILPQQRQAAGEFVHLLFIAAEGDAEVGERSFICLRHLFDEF